MAQVAHATNYSRLNDRLDSARVAFSEDGRVTPLLLASLESDIRKLIKADAANGWDLLSQWYVFKGDVNSVRSAFQNSLRLDRSVAIARLLNYFNSLMTLSRTVLKPELCDEAEEILMQAYEIGKTGFSQFSLPLCDKLFGYQYYEKALEVATMIQLATVNNPISEKEVRFDFLNRLIKDSGLPIQHCAPILKLLFKFLCSKSIPFRIDRIGMDVRVFEIHGCLRFAIGLENQTTEQLVALQWEFEEARAEYDFEHDVNSYMMVYDIVTADDVVGLLSLNALAH